ncbi:MAG: HAD family hydrolase [Candidatus Asgardarchaeia archaeon]
MSRLFVFDLDGTLIDNDLDFKSMKKSVMEYISMKYGIDESIYDDRDKTKDILRKTASILRKKGIEISEAILLKEIDPILKKYEWEGAKNSRLKRCSREVLEYLKKLNFKVAILTNEPSDVVNFLLEELSIREFFDLVVTRDLMGELKPSAKGIKMISERMKVREDEIVFIGDSSIDYKTAEMAGCHFWFLSKGNVPNCLKAEVILKDLCELLDILIRTEGGSWGGIHKVGGRIRS